MPVAPAPSFCHVWRFISKEMDPFGPGTATRWSLRSPCRLVTCTPVRCVSTCACPFEQVAKEPWAAFEKQGEETDDSTARVNLEQIRSRASWVRPFRFVFLICFLCAVVCISGSSPDLGLLGRAPQTGPWRRAFRHLRRRAGDGSNGPAAGSSRRASSR